MEFFRVKNTDTRLGPFPIFKSDGTLITGAAGLDSEYALNGGHGGTAPSFSDCSHEATEVGSTGFYYLDVNAAEVNDDTGSTIQVKSSTTGEIVQTLIVNTAVYTELAAIHAHAAAADTKTASLTYTVANQVDVNVVDWKGSAAPAMTGDAYARLGAPAGASTAADIAAINTLATNNTAKYMHGAVWVDTVNGATGTTAYTNGIATNPSNSIANAKTIADNLKLKRFWIQAGSAITLGAAYAGYIFDGRGYTLDLGTRDVSKSQFERVEGLSGTGTCASGEAVVFDSHLGTITIGEADFTRCHLNAVVTMSQASVPYLFNQCVGVGSGGGITFAAAGQTAVVSKWGGYLTVAGMVAGNTLYLDGDGEVVFAASCTGGTVYIAGNMTYTMSGTGVTVTQTARFDTSQLPTPLDAAGVRSAVGLATANLDTQLSAANNGTPPSASTIAAAILTTPANKLATDASGYVTASNVSGLTVEVGSYATGMSPGEQVTVPAAEDVVAAFAATYDLATEDQLATAAAAKVLATPANLIATDVSGNVSVAGLGGSVTVGGYDTGMSPAEQIDVSGLSTFDPATDTVARVTLTDTTTTLTNAPSGGTTAQQVWEYANRGLTDKSGYSLTAAYNITPALIADAVCDEQLSGHTAAGSLGKTISDAGVSIDFTPVTDAIDALHDFNPATDVVAHVTLADTVTTLTNAPVIPAGIALTTDVTAARDVIRGDVADVDDKAALLIDLRVGERDTTDSSDIIYNANGDKILDQAIVITPLGAHAERSSV